MIKFDLFAIISYCGEIIYQPVVGVNNDDDAKNMSCKKRGWSSVKSRTLLVNLSGGAASEWSYRRALTEIRLG